jgi:hypothetical protein
MPNLSLSLANSDLLIDISTSFIIVEILHGSGSAVVSAVASFERKGLSMKDRELNALARRAML